MSNSHPFPCSHASRAGRRPVRLASLALAAGVSLALLAGCGKKSNEPTQTAAKVNKEEITVHQINYVLSQQPPAPPAMAASASRQALERLIDQELELQQAEDQKLDRQPRVQQQIEAAKREIVARAYLDKIGQGAPKPTPAEVSAYYEANPDLFANRRVYNLQDVNIQATPEQVTALKTALPAAKTFADFITYLKTNSYHFSGGEAVRTAEQLPLANVKQFAALKDGQAVFSPRPGGAQILYLVQSKTVPIDQQHATPAIEQFLFNQRKLKLVADDLLELRKKAKIEYMGEFAAAAAADPYRPPPGPELAPLISIAPPASEAAASAAPQVDVAPPEAQVASMPSDATLDKGLKGFK